MSLSHPHPYHRKPKSSRKKLKLIWRRPSWALTTAPRYRYFDSLEEAMAYVRLLYAWRRASPGLCARLEERNGGGRWHELPELARLWSESGWSK
jgi:hypothetical protein